MMYHLPVHYFTTIVAEATTTSATMVKAAMNFSFMVLFLLGKRSPPKEERIRYDLGSAQATRLRTSPQEALSICKSNIHYLYQSRHRFL